MCMCAYAASAEFKAPPVTPEIDIWRSANIMVREHGENAAMVAAQRADAFLAAGDIDGRVVWKRILVAIAELQRRHLNAGESLN